MTLVAGALAASVVLAVPGSGAVASSVPGPVPSSTVCTVTDPRIDEASGLVDLGPDMVVTDDSGDGPVLYVLDGRCRVVGTTTYAGPGAARDVEALGPAGPHAVWVADIGDNARVRDEVVVRRVPVGRGDRTVAAPTYRLVYPDGPHDAETLLVQPGTERLFVVTKQPLRAEVFAAPARLSADGVNQLRRVAAVSMFATDGSFLPAGRRVLVRGYPSAPPYSFPDWKPLRTFALPEQPQGESLSVGPGGRVRIGSEGVGEAVLQVDLSRGGGSGRGESDAREEHEVDDDRADRAARPAWATTLLWAAPALLLVPAAWLVTRWRGRRRDRRDQDVP